MTTYKSLALRAGGKGLCYAGSAPPCTLVYRGSCVTILAAQWSGSESPVDPYRMVCPDCMWLCQLSRILGSYACKKDASLGRPSGAPGYGIQR